MGTQKATGQWEEPTDPRVPDVPGVGAVLPDHPQQGTVVRAQRWNKICGLSKRCIWGGGSR